MCSGSLDEGVIFLVLEDKGKVIYRGGGRWDG